jgi:hypothetical protein
MNYNKAIEENYKNDFSTNEIVSSLLFNVCVLIRL